MDCQTNFISVILFELQIWSTNHFVLTVVAAFSLRYFSVTILQRI